MVALAGDGLLFAEVRAAVIFRVELHLCSGLKDRSLWAATPSVACSVVLFAVCCSKAILGQSHALKDIKSVSL